MTVACDKGLRQRQFILQDYRYTDLRGKILNGFYLYLSTVVKNNFVVLYFLYFHIFATLNIQSTRLRYIILGFSGNVMRIFIKDNKQFTFSL